MKIASKIVKLILLLIIILVVIAGAGFYFFGERVLKIGVETAATRALGVGVEIKDVDLSVLKGSVEIEGLKVKNPAGYTYENLLELRRGRIKVSIGSLMSDTVRIEEIKLEGVNLVIEQKMLSNNLQDVLGSLEAASKVKDESAKEGKKLQIDYLEINNIKARVKLLPVPGKADTVTLDIAPIKMTNLGSDSKLDAGILSAKIMLAIAEGVTEQGVGVLPEEIIGTMQSTLKRTVDLGKDATKEAERIIDVGKEAIDIFKGLTKPKKEK